MSSEGGRSGVARTCGPPLDDGTLERLGRGVHRKTDAPLADHDLIEVALRAPDATLGLVTALAQHDLTDPIPATINIALPRSRRAPKVEATRPLAPLP